MLADDFIVFDFATECLCKISQENVLKSMIILCDWFSELI